MVPADRHARRDQRDSADTIEPALAAEPTEKREATEATEPIERTDPAEPIHRIEPAEPIDKIDPLDPMLRSEPAEPADRGEISVFAMLGFSHPCGITAFFVDMDTPGITVRPLRTMHGVDEFAEVFFDGDHSPAGQQSFATPEFLYRYSGQTKAGIACLRMKMTISECQEVTRPER